MEKIFITKRNDFKTIKAKTEEQETTINLSRDSDAATIWTNDNTIITKLSKMIEKNPSEWICYLVGDANNPTGYFFETKKKYICFREGKRKITSNTMTEEHKKKLIESAKRAREDKKNND